MGSLQRPRSQETAEVATRQALKHYDLACEHLADENWTAAEAQLRKALRLQPSFPDCQRRLAALKRQQGEEAAAGTRSASLGLTPKVEQSLPVATLGRLATPAGLTRPAASARKATGRVVPATAPAARRRPRSPRSEIPAGPAPTLLSHRMEQLKEQRAKEEVVKRLYGWEESKQAKIEQRKRSAAPSFTPQPYAVTRNRLSCLVVVSRAQV